MLSEPDGVEDWKKKELPEKQSLASRRGPLPVHSEGNMK